MQSDILDLAYEVSRVTGEKIDLIESVMRQTHLLALNARIEATRAGPYGSAFSIVAQEMSQVSVDINEISKELRSAINDNAAKLEIAGSEMMMNFRGTRFTDLAHNAIELIDRNLYERSCDVRWWATDSAVVAAAAEMDQESRRYASLRLATILRSYTVYLDLWVADRSGRVIANGRPKSYPSVVGRDVSQQGWFTDAIATRNGDCFSVADIQTVKPLNDAAVAIYGTAIREGGRADGKVIGALGIFFDWAPQAAAIVENLGLTRDEKAECRVMLLDGKLRVIAASDGRGLLSEKYHIDTSAGRRGFYKDQDAIKAFAITPGYETYKGLGWYGVIEWRMKKSC